MRIQQGFTLIELSIVLVIVGLIVGGIVVGRELIGAGEVRAQLSQIANFQQAANTFKGKYGSLPGDLHSVSAATFGFASRTGAGGRGDGNGYIQGYDPGIAYSGCGLQGAGESVMFWSDLSYAGGMNISLIEGNYSTASFSSTPSFPVSGTRLALFLPQAKFASNYIYVDCNINTGINFYGLTAVSAITGGTPAGGMTEARNIQVKQAYSIDAKIDDGMPLTGIVLAINKVLAAVPAYTYQTAGSIDTCFDNNNVLNATYYYSLGQNGGNGANCGLQFRFQ